MTNPKNSPFRRSLSAVACSLATSATEAASRSELARWDAAPQRSTTFLASPAQQALLILVIVALGFALSFSERPILRRVLGVILGAVIAIAAASFAVSFFSFSTGAIFSKLDTIGDLATTTLRLFPAISVTCGGVSND